MRLERGLASFVTRTPQQFRFSSHRGLKADAYRMIRGNRRQVHVQTVWTDRVLSHQFRHDSKVWKFVLLHDIGNLLGNLIR